jgi:hypothetical protein
MIRRGIGNLCGVASRVSHLPCRVSEHHDGWKRQPRIDDRLLNRGMTVKCGRGVVQCIG